MKGNYYMGYWDMHCHILPGVDDGARSIEESVKMLGIASKSNITDIILTPHYKIGRYEIDKAEMRDEIKKFRLYIKDKFPGINIYEGTELMFSEDAVELLEEDKILTMNKTKCVLVEFHPSHNKKYIKESLYKVVCAGYTPVVAHIDRYADMIEAYDTIEDIIDMGALIQVNADAVTGKMGRLSKKFTKMLMKYDMLHFIGSDAHSTRSRTPDLSECAAYIEKKFGKEYRDELLILNPKKYFTMDE